MSYTAITAPSQGDATKVTLAQAMADNFAYLKAELDKLKALLIPNGSFESPQTNGADPDLWAITENSGWAVAIDNTDSSHGNQSCKFTTPGSTAGTGAYIDMAAYLECSPNRQMIVGWEQKSSVAAIRVFVSMRFYDAALAFVSASTLYDSTSNPTSFSSLAGAVTPPSTARFCKLRIQCDDSGNTTAGNVKFDNVQLMFGASVPTLESLNTGASSPWTVPSGVTKIRVRCWGGGAGGNTANGGPAGGYGEGVFSVSPGEQYTVTIGAGGAAFSAGGTTSLGALISATGGAAPATNTGGTSSATVNVAGGIGRVHSVSGEGGQAGGGGGHGGNGGAVTGSAGVVPGGGGGSGSGTPAAGGDGRIIIEY